MSIVPINAEVFTPIQEAEALNPSTLFCKHLAILKYRSFNTSNSQKFNLTFDVIRNSQLSNYDFFNLNIFCNSIMVYSQKIDFHGQRIKFPVYDLGDLYFSIEISLDGSTQVAPLDSNASLGIYLKPVLQEPFLISGGGRHYVASSHASMINLGLDGIYLGKHSVLRLQQAILKALSEKKPFSCIRLGDGEGRILGYPDFFKDLDIAIEVFNYQFGPESVSILAGSRYQLSEHISLLKNLLCAAISSADFIGVPVADFFPGDLENSNLRSEHLAYSIAFNYCLLARRDFDENDLVGTNIFQLLCTHTNFMSTIIKKAKRVFYMYPTNMLDELKKINSEKTYIHLPIPSHSTHSILYTRYGQFPLNYKYISNQISSYGDLSGDLFLVAGGLMGKHYANFIRSRGGVALDIGSVFDSWIQNGLPYAVDNEVPLIENMPCINLDEWAIGHLDS